MLSAMLEAGADDFVSAALADWPDAVDVLLKLIDSSSIGTQEPEIVGQLSDRHVVGWLQKNGPSPPIGALLVQSWSPQRSRTVPVGELGGPARPRSKAD